VETRGREVYKNVNEPRREGRRGV